MDWWSEVEVYGPGFLDGDDIGAPANGTHHFGKLGMWPCGSARQALQGHSDLEQSVTSTFGSFVERLH